MYLNHEVSNMPHLVKPQACHRQAHLEYLHEWGEEEIVPMSSSLGDQSFEQWLEQLARYETDPPTDFVPASTWFLMEGERILGAVNIRHQLNDYLLRAGGHIGYGIRPSERRRGLAKLQLALALPLAKELGLDRVLITCDRDNLGSAKTILANGGVLENEVEDRGDIVQRYWVKLV